jgi:hypothetical protein
MERLQLILRAQSDPDFFLDSEYFMGDMAGMAFPMQRQLFCDFYNGNVRDNNGKITHSGKIYKELDVAGGMGGGKSALGSFFLARETFDILIREDPAKDFRLASHSLITVYAIAKSLDQAADTIFGELKLRLHSPFFQEFKPKFGKYIVTFEEHSDIQVCAGGAISAGSLMGRNVKAVGFDEITSYDETQSQRGAWQVYSRLRKSTNRFGFQGRVFVISMVWHINDIMMTLIREEKPDALVAEVPTWEMNPNKALDSPEMQMELKRDPLTFWRDYGVKPYSSFESFYPDASVININPDRENILEGAWELWKSNPEFKSAKEFTYILATDPGRRNDTFGIALVHREGKRTIIDGCMRLKPKPGEMELDPIEVRDFCVWLSGAFPTRAFVTDVAALYFADVEERIRRLGIQVVSHPNTKEDHDRVKRAWYDNTLEICNYEPVRVEFQNLTVLNSMKIGIPKGAIIDVVDAITRGMWASHEFLAQNNHAYHLIRVI